LVDLTTATKKKSMEGALGINLRLRRKPKVERRGNAQPMRQVELGLRKKGEGTDG